MRLRRKLTLGFMAVASLVGVAGIFGLIASRQIVRHFEGGEAHYRSIVSNATAASRLAKDAQSHLTLFLALNEPVDREVYRRALAQLEETVALLDGQVRGTKARPIVERMKGELGAFREKSDALLERYDWESPVGGFHPRNHAILFREVNQLGSSIRQSGVDLAGVETDFLNKQTAITASTLVSSFAKRAEGHLMLYLALGNPEDRDTFWKRHASLMEQVHILKDRVEDVEGTAILSGILTGADRIRAAGETLLSSFDRDTRETGRFLPKKHEEWIRELHQAASGVQASGALLADHNIRIEKGNKESAVRKANAIAHSILVVAMGGIGMALLFGFIFSRHIAEPLKRLGDAAVRIGKGDLDAPIDGGGNDEVGDLARSVRRMAGDLKTTMVSRDHFENILQSMNDCLVVADQGGRAMTVNPALCEMLGYRPDELLGRTVAPLFGKDERMLDSLRGELHRNGHLRNEEITCRARDGREVSVLLSGALIRDPAGQPQFMVFVAKDIRDRKRAEEELRLSEERFRQLFEQIHEPFLLLRAETGDLVDANPAAVELYGYPKEDLISGGTALFVPPGHREEFSAAIRGIGPEGRLFIPKTTHLRRGGGERFVSIAGKSILLRNERIVYCTVRDITERIRVEEDARLQHAMLIHANRMASLGTVVSGVAHEVNNPNSSIMINMPIIRSAWEDAVAILDRHHRSSGDFQLAGFPYPEARGTVSRMIRDVSAGSSRINTIVANLKGFARQEDRSQDPIDVNDIVRAVVTILNHEIMKGTHRFRTVFGAGLPKVAGSAPQLEQVVMNLVLNALQSLPDPGRTVEVSTGFGERTGTVEIRVRDEGEGIPRDLLDRITDPFFTTKHASGGLGLGLHISRAIVEKHGGEMNFRSTLGVGTEAVIALPLADREERMQATS